MDSKLDLVESEPPIRPKVFVSYAHDYKDIVKDYADRLITEAGIDVRVDFYDLAIGHDLNAYMEGMVSDPSIDFVLLFCTKTYTEKANSRHGGVGTESVIISQEVYKNMTQTKFIPIACEVEDNGNFTLPVFIQGRNCINFTSPQKVNAEWDNLIRAIYRKPRYKKPKLGAPPVFTLQDTEDVFINIREGLREYKSSVHHGALDSQFLMKDFLAACETEIDRLRIREPISDLTVANTIVNIYTTLKRIRNYLLEWLWFEVNLASTQSIDLLIQFLERILGSKVRPQEIDTWNECWFDSHKLFLHELYVYIVGMMLKVGKIKELAKICGHKYLIPEGFSRYDIYFQDFTIFYGMSTVIKEEIRPSEERYYVSPSAELFKRNADFEPLAFEPFFMEAELLLFMLSLLKTQSVWNPWSLIYRRYGQRPFPFFLNATKREGFAELAILTGIDSPEALKEVYKQKIAEVRLFFYPEASDLERQVWSSANMDAIGSI